MFIATVKNRRIKENKNKNYWVLKSPAQAKTVLTCLMGDLCCKATSLPGSGYPKFIGEICRGVGGEKLLMGRERWREGRGRKVCRNLLLFHSYPFAAASFLHPPLFWTLPQADGGPKGSGGTVPHGALSKFQHCLAPSKQKSPCQTWQKTCGTPSSRDLTHLATSPYHAKALKQGGHYF